MEGPLVFVDIETNGLSAIRGNIIEVAAIRVENGVITQTFNSVVNPGNNLPAFISQLTGIHDVDLARAPAFADIATELWDVMEGAVFIAHNVRFDYSFLRQEFDRVGKRFNPKLLCTVKLSRAMYPTERGHKLQDLIVRCGLNADRRHRAYDDADVMWQFLQHLQTKFPQEIIDKAIARQVKAPALPKYLSPSLISSLPEGPGVYIFLDFDNNPLYIGKSVSLKKRILSHFSGDHSSELEFKITQSIADVQTQTTSGELEALLLESRLIKEMQPLYNRQLRRYQKLTLARRTMNPDGYISLSLDDTATIDPDLLDDILNVYTTKSQARNFLTEICKTYGLCPRVLGLEKGSGACFSYQLKKCRGACVGEHSVEEFNATLLDIFENKRVQNWPFDTPVMIAENSGQGEIYGSIVVDNWCVVADISQADECSPNVKFHKKAFDIDSYQILKHYLDANRHRLTIKPITHSALAELSL